MYTVLATGALYGRTVNVVNAVNAVLGVDWYRKMARHVLSLCTYSRGASH